MAITREAVNEWRGILESKSFSPIVGANSTIKKRTLVQLLENCSDGTMTVFENVNSVKALSKKILLAEAPTTATISPAGPTTIGAVQAGIAAGGLGVSVDPVTNVAQGNVGDGSQISGMDQTMISLIRRTAPHLIAYDLVGVQPMSGPTGLIFALHARALAQDGTNGAELFGGPGAPYLNAGLQFASASQGAPGVVGAPDPMLNQGFAKISTQTGEVLGGPAYQWKRATMTISRVNVQADTKALMAEYTHEIVQDMKRVHGIDAEAELSNILATEIAFEQNRELIETIRASAKLYGTGTVDLTLGGVSPAVLAAGSPSPVTGNFGAFGSAERFKALLLHIEKASNEIARDTRRGKANWIMCSSDVVALLHLAGVLTINPDLKLSVDLADDAAGANVVGTLIGGQKVICDPYAQQGQVIVGYKGKNAVDSGMFWCPYIPLEKAQAIDPNTLQPKMGFKVRYGIGANPHAQGFFTAAGGAYGGLTGNQPGLYAANNVYYRAFNVLY